MKTYCKGLDICNRDLITQSIWECIKGKLHRRDTLELLSSFTKYTPKKFSKMIKETSGKIINPIIELLTTQIISEISNRELKLKPIWYKSKKDGSSGKIREIGIQDVKQQIYDYIAVNAMKPLLKRIGEYQCSSIKGRGQSYGIRAIKRWLKDKRIRHIGKADIRKCYESIDKKKLMEFLSYKIKNEPLLWLIETLINTFKKGLSIGSYLSQFLCNLFLSQLYHYISEGLFRIRKHRDGSYTRVKLIYHTLFYMDDIIILGTNLKDIKIAMKKIIEYIKKLKLSVKKDWRIFSLDNDDKVFIDMMGVRFYRSHCTIRRRVFRRIRRTFSLLDILRRTHQIIPMKLIRRAIAYYGKLLATNSFILMKRYNIQSNICFCKGVISYESKISNATA